MFMRRRLLYALAVGLLALGPALSLPVLSAHTPTLTAPTAPTQQSPLGSPFALLLPALAGTIKVKDAATVAAKWKTRAGAAQSDFVNGATAAAGDFETKSLQAEDVYKQAVTEAASKGRYGQGLRGSGAKYARNVQAVGGARFQQGVANGADAMAGGIGPVLQTIAAINLPPRGVKGTNQERSNIVATALRKMKVGS